MTTTTQTILGTNGTIHHVEVVRVRDLTTGAVHELDASTPVDRVSKRDAQGASHGVDRAAPDSEWSGLTLADLGRLDLAYVASEDEGETAGTVTWWLSEVVDIATPVTPVQS